MVYRMTKDTIDLGSCFYAQISSPLASKYTTNIREKSKFTVSEAGLKDSLPFVSARKAA